MEEIKMKRNSYEGVKNKRNGSEMVRVKKINGKNKWEASSMAVQGSPLSSRGIFVLPQRMLELRKTPLTQMASHTSRKSIQREGKLYLIHYDCLKVVLLILIFRQCCAYSYPTAACDPLATVQEIVSLDRIVFSDAIESNQVLHVNIQCSIFRLCPTTSKHLSLHIFNAD